MGRLIGHFFVWNSAQFMAWRLLETHKFVDAIFIFDGAYQVMKDKGFTKVPHSTDGTRNIANALRRKLKCKIKYMREKKFYPNAPAAYRKRSLKCWKKGEWMYLMADDEMLMGNVKKAFKKIRNEKKAKVIYVPMKELTLGRQQYIDLGWKRRFFIWQPGLHWGSHHSDLRNKKGVHVSKWPAKRISDMWILHLRNLKFPERKRAANAFRRLNI